MDKDLMPTREEYRLTLEHRFVGADGKSVRIEEPKAYSLICADMGNDYIISYRSHMIESLFMRFMQQVLREVEGSNG